jgi:hypothetical protein
VLLLIVKGGAWIIRKILITNTQEFIMNIQNRLFVLTTLVLTITTFVNPAIAEQDASSAAKSSAKEPAPAAEPPPLPFHTIEGYGGGAITPMAYLVNPGPENSPFGLPAAAFSYVNLGHKNLEAFTVTETLFRRIELGYGLDRLGLGTLPDDIEDATGVDIERDDVLLHNFNLRGLLVEENTAQLPLPALTAGVHFKVNDGIGSIDDKLNGALENINYEKSNGVDFTLTASKTIPNVFTRPLILTGGLRNSSAAQLGFLGFGDKRSTTFEGNVAYLPTDWLLVAYEFRQKSNPYDKIPGLVGDEDNWHAVDVSWIVNKHATIVAGWGAFGNLANHEENGAWWLQFKYEL